MRSSRAAPSQAAVADEVAGDRRYRAVQIDYLAQQRSRHPFGSASAQVSEGSVARLAGTITGNGGAGVLIQDLSMVTFNGATVTGNGGGTDVICNPQYPVTRGVADTGGTTNCVEP